MDNITHSLVGILTAESALEVLRIRQPNTVLTRKTRIAFWLSALLANNFCDLDFIPTLFLEPKRLQYLLHHRGHTHTLLLAPLQALIILLGFWGWGQWKKTPWEKHEKVGVSVLTLLGVVLHLFLDFLNQYGVHPFWPFYNGWFYADMMFIVEPWIWLTLLPLLWFSTRHRWVRASVGGLLISACALLALSGFVPKTMAVLVTLWGAGLMLVFAYVSHRFRLSIAYFMLGVVGLIFGLESYGLKKEILNRFKLEEPSVTVNDIILSPFPSNPICWQVVTVETFSKREFFRLRKGVISLFSNWYSPSDCLSWISSQTQVAPTHPQVIWTSQMKFSRKKLKKIYEENCLAAAQLRFVRAPFWYEKDGKLFLADLRFETGTRGNFSRLEIPSHPNPCPRWIPPWSEPRADLLKDEK